MKARLQYHFKGITFCILCIGLLNGIPVASAQEVQFTGSTKPNVILGETFTLSYSVNGQGTNFKGPSLGNFAVLSGPNTSTTSSIRSVNGRTTMSITYTYTYILQAVKEGTFEIPPATVVVENRNYSSNTLSVVVSKSQGSSSAGQNPNRSQQGQETAQSASNDVFLRVSISNTNPVQGEGIVVVYKLFTKVPIAQLVPTKPSFAGFWSQNLIKENEKFNQYRQVIDGQQYTVAEIAKYALFPLKSGRIVIEPMDIQCIAQVRTQSRQRTGDPFFDDFFNDSFFNSGIASVEKSLRSNALVINVKPLPSANKPADFNGAVGNYTLKSEIDKLQTKANEPITLKFTISGQGNIQLIDKLNVVLPPDFESYDPKVTSTVNTGNNGVSGSQVFEYLIIPRKPGDFIIKPVTFSYFDYTKNRYMTQSTPQYSIRVEKGTGESSPVVYSGTNKEEIKYIGSDIRFIKNAPMLLRPVGTYFFGSLPFYLWLGIPLLLFILLIILWRRQKERSSDIVLMKNRKATKVARRRLKRAEDFLKTNEQESFYIEISKALWGYLSDKFGIPLSDLSMDSVHDALLSKGVSEEVIHHFTAALNSTEFARFAPGEKTFMMEKVYQEVFTLLTRTEREIKIH